jgi:hypothetical protein
MEVLGAAFTLPPEDVHLMDSAFAIYKEWLFKEENACVPPFLESIQGIAQEQEMWLKILQHFSLIFEPRSATSSDTQTSPVQGSIPRSLTFSGNGGFVPDEGSRKFVDTCHTIVRCIFLVIRRLGDEFTRETWDTVIKIIFGIVDGLLKEPPLSKEKQKLVSKLTTFSEEKRSDLTSYLADSLAESLIFLLAETWLRSQTTNQVLWDILKVKFF